MFASCEAAEGAAVQAREIPVFVGRSLKELQQSEPTFEPSDPFHLVIPDGETCVEPYAFDSCTWIRSVTIPIGVAAIGEFAFLRCSTLSSVNFPPSVTMIGRYCFNGTGFTSVTIPDTITTISMSAFSDCERLSSVTISESPRLKRGSLRSVLSSS
eukprot:m.355949 g.355949  ORF g.355949 m.355949 type:complete len:156 (-) comp16603_c0_seq8:952-1419(-)